MHKSNFQRHFLGFGFVASHLNRIVIGSTSIDYFARGIDNLQAVDRACEAFRARLLRA